MHHSACKLVERQILHLSQKKGLDWAEELSLLGLGKLLGNVVSEVVCEKIFKLGRDFIEKVLLLILG